MIKNVLIAFLILSSGVLLGKESAEFSIIEDRASLPILTPSFADRHTLKLRLNNGLEAYLVSDPETDKSSAALTVKTGSWEDPVEYPGIAHFLEHMLFLGTKKFPNESEYDRFISEQGGQFNAFTAPDFTSYIFSIDNQAFPEALDRFSNFFKEPLFNPSGVERELQAIDQEYAKNIESDDIREYYVHKELAYPSHPNHAFSMGNRSSLLKVSQETLKNWYHQHYSANRMRLAVVSNEPLEKLIELVIANFKDIPNNNLPPLDVDMPLLPETIKGHMVYLEPIKNLRKLTLIWELPSRFATMRDTKPEQIICQVLGHEGKKSLLNNLKQEKLAETVACGGERIGGRVYELFLEISLTDLGVKNVDKVILRCFEALANFKQKGVPQYLFDELHAIQKINYQYQDRHDSFEDIIEQAVSIANENMTTYPEQSKIIQRFDPKAVEDLLNQLTPYNCVFDIIAPTTLTEITLDRKEHWLNIPYAVKAIPEETLEEWNNAEPNPQIDLPEPNIFMPEQLSLVSTHIDSKDNQQLIPHPQTIISNEQGKIYFAEDHRYSLPNISWLFEIKTPSINIADPESIVLGDLYVKYALEALSYYTYPASLAGLTVNIARTRNGLSISVDGYSEKASVLFIDIIKGLKDLRLREQKFKIFKEVLQRQYQNGAVDKPLVQASEVLKSILYKDFATEKSKALAIKKITFENFEEFVEGLFASTFIEGVMYGNMKEDEAKQLTSELLATLASEPYPKSEQLKEEVIVLPEDKGPFFIETKTKAQGNAVILAVESLPFSFQARAAQQLLMQAMKEPFFSTLRTKQQTGYIVYSKAEELEMHLFNLFAVQSNTHAGRDLLARFELFIEGFMQEITKSEIPPERFERIRRTLVADLKQPPKNISEMAQTLCKLAFTYEGDFDWISKRIQAMEQLTYNDLLEYAYQTFDKTNKRRCAVLLSGSVSEDSTLQYKKVCGLGQLRKLSTYEPAKEAADE